MKRALRSLAFQGLSKERTDALRRWVVHIVVLTAALAAAVAALAAVMPMIGDPAVIIDTRSDAVAFVPAATLELVALARPRHGLHPDGSGFVGIRFDPALGADSVPALLGGRDLEEPADTAQRRALVLQHLEVTAGCVVRVERLVAGWIRLGVLPDSDAGDSGGCRVFGELYWDAAGVGSLEEFGATVDNSRSLSFSFRPAHPLRLQRFAIARLGFDSRESGEWRSSILDGTIRLPDHGDDVRRIYLADALSLGSLEGEVVELAIGDSIRTQFRGTADDPAISGRSIQPTLLRQALHSEGFQIALAVAFGVVTLIAAILQAILA